jgi:hypothetical protein
MASTIPPQHPLFREVMRRAFNKDETSALAIAAGGAVPVDGGWAALGAAAHRGWPGVARTILRAVAPGRKPDGNIALALAAGGGHLAVMRELKECGAATYCTKAMIDAARAGQLAPMQLLRDWGADIGDSVTLAAAHASQLAALHLLRSWGAQAPSSPWRKYTIKGAVWKLLEKWEADDASR